MILSNQLKEHLKGPIGIFIATRDKNLDCDAARVLGALASGHDTIKFYLGEKFADKTLDNLRSNKLVSLSATNVFTLESFQFKGRLLSIRPTNEEESNAVSEYVNQFDEAVTKLGYRQGIVLDNTVYNPSLAVEFIVDQIFDQTPKAGAGKQLATV